MSAPSDTETLNGEFGSKKLTLDNGAIRVNIELGPGKTDIGGMEACRHIGHKVLRVMSGQRIIFLRNSKSSFGKLATDA